jgi:hypothetical protein
VLHARERGGAAVAEFPLHARVASLTWRAADAAASGASAASHAACLRTELLPAYLLHKIALLEKEEAASTSGGARADADADAGSDVADADDGGGADGDARSCPAAAAFLACVAPRGGAAAGALAAAPCTASARAVWPRAQRPWAHQLGFAPAAADVASAVPMPQRHGASVAVVLVRTVEKLCDTLAAAADGTLSAPALPLRPAAAAAALRALRPALLDLLHLAPPEAPTPLQPLPPQGQHPSSAAATSAAAAAAAPQFIHAPASCGAVLASLAAVAAPFSREYIAEALRDADAALASAHRDAGAAAPADVAGGALPWLERYLEAPPGSMLRAALVTAAQEAPLTVRGARACV